MACKASGKYSREGISFARLFALFPPDAAADEWFVQQRWPEGPLCESIRVQSGTAHKTMPFRYRERECRERFSVRTESCMEASNLGFQIWPIAIYIMSTSLKGVSSMKLHRGLEITRKSARHLAKRLQKALEDDGVNLSFIGPVTWGESYICGLEKNKHRDKKPKAGCHDAREAGTEDRMEGLVVDMAGKWPCHRDLIAVNGLLSGAGA